MTLITRIIFIFIILMLMPTCAFAARAYDIIEKTFVIYGKDADAVATLLGMSSSRTNTLKLSWNVQTSTRNCTWGDVPADSTWKRCEDLPILVNVFNYVPGKLSELRLSGHWFDFTTGSGPGFAIFSFDSPEFNVGQEMFSDWNYVLHGAISRIPMTMQEGFKRSRIFIGSAIPFFEVQMIELVDGQRRLAISLDFDTVEQHKQKVLAHKECQKKYGHLEGGC